MVDKKPNRVVKPPAKEKHPTSKNQRPSHRIEPRVKSEVKQSIVYTVKRESPLVKLAASISDSDSDISLNVPEIPALTIDTRKFKGGSIQKDDSDTAASPRGSSKKSNQLRPAGLDTALKRKRNNSIGTKLRFAVSPLPAVELDIDLKSVSRNKRKKLKRQLEAAEKLQSIHDKNISLIQKLTEEYSEAADTIAN